MTLEEMNQVNQAVVQATQRLTDLKKILDQKERSVKESAARALEALEENARLKKKCEDLQAMLLSTQTQSFRLVGERDFLQSKLNQHELLQNRDVLAQMYVDLCKSVKPMEGEIADLKARLKFVTDTPKLGITRDERKMLRELAAKSTRVQGWYAHSQYDGYHPGKASVRGPFGRWLLVEGGENKPGELGQGVADLYDDAKFAAAAMNNLPALLDALDRIDPPVQTEKISIPMSEHERRAWACEAKACPGCESCEPKHSEMGCACVTWPCIACGKMRADPDETEKVCTRGTHTNSTHYDDWCKAFAAKDDKV